MKLFNSKKSELITLIVVIAVIAFVFIMFFQILGARECSKNSECPKNHYCGSDFSCHEIPLIEKEISQNNLIIPALILGVCMIITALILKNKNTKKPKTEKTEE